MSDLTADYYCAEGYFCYTGATTTTPTILAEGGGICPAGYYCPSPDNEVNGAGGLSGTQAPHPCEPGTYRSSTGGFMKLDDSGNDEGCKTCPEGYYC